MRFHVAGPSRAKSLAKNLHRSAFALGLHVSLSACQAAAAEALGYSSFAELLKVSGRAPPSPCDDQVDAVELADRFAVQSGAFARRLGLQPDVASALARNAALTARPGKGIAPRSGPTTFETTHHWPVRYLGSLAELSAEVLESLDTIIETLSPGGRTIGMSETIAHVIAAEARMGTDPHVAVRYAYPSEVLEFIDPDDGDWERDEEEDAETLNEFCHPSMRGEG